MLNASSIAMIGKKLALELVRETRLAFLIATTKQRHVRTLVRVSKIAPMVVMDV